MMPTEQQERAFAHEMFAAAFAEWERRYREEPERFMSDFHRYTQETAQTYGTQCATFFSGLLDEIDDKRLGDAILEPTGA